MSGRQEEQFGDGATAEEVSDQKQAGPGVPGRMPRSLPAHCKFLDFLGGFFFIIVIANNLKTLMWRECSNSHSRVCPIFKKSKTLCSNVVLAVTKPAEVTKMQLLKFKKAVILITDPKRTAHLLVLF